MNKAVPMAESFMLHAELTEYMGERIVRMAQE